MPGCVRNRSNHQVLGEVLPIAGRTRAGGGGNFICNVSFIVATPQTLAMRGLRGGRSGLPAEALNVEVVLTFLVMDVFAMASRATILAARGARVGDAAWVTSDVDVFGSLSASMSGDSEGKGLLLVWLISP